jgi:hypothetical protein
MRLHCQFTAPVARSELDDYVRPLDIGVLCYDADMLNEYVVGRLAIDHILWAQAQVDGVSLFDVCDNDSQGLHEVHAILTGGKEDFLRALRIKEPVDHVLFLHAAVFHPAIHPARQGILDAAFHLFGELSLAVMWRDTGGLPEADLAALGFARIAGAELIYRHLAVRTPFGDAHPQGLEPDVEARPEYEEWVEQEWDRYWKP